MLNCVFYVTQLQVQASTKQEWDTTEPINLRFQDKVMQGSVNSLDDRQLNVVQSKGGFVVSFLWKFYGNFRGKVMGKCSRQALALSKGLNWNDVLI